MEVNFENYLRVNAQEVEKELDKILSQFLAEAKKISPKLLPLVAEFVKSCQGGKRIRGVLVKLGYEMTQSVILSETKDLSRMRVPNELRDSSPDFHRGQNDIYKVGAALEILHAAILVHDDIIDQSPKRRGQPTLYQSLGGDHYGISQAMILGDIGLYLQTKIITETNFLAENKIKALNHLSKMIINTGWGEALDVEIPHLKKVTLEEDIKLIQVLKTAQYTISGPLILGTILAAGGQEELLRELRVFGENLGIAFQIQDDILGVFGEEKQIGKSNTSDIEEGKVTHLYSYALKNAGIEQKQTLRQYYGKGSVGSKGLELVRQIFKTSGALDYANTKAVEYAFKAKKMIPKITQDKEMGKLLESMTKYLVERQS